MGKPRIKLYQDAEGKPKGDGLVTYLQEGSVTLACKLLDGLEIIKGYKIKCSVAEFQVKGTYNPNKRPKLNKTQQKILRQLNNQNLSKLSWEVDENKLAPQLRIVVLHHMFTLDEVTASGSPTEFYAKLEDEVGMEAQRIGGPIDKLTIFEGSRTGTIAVKYKNPAGAKKCVEAMHGRWFACRQVICEYWDGVTDFRIKETEEEEEARIKAFQAYLESGEAKKMNGTNAMDEDP